MPANTNPIACAGPNVGLAVIASGAAANTAIDGTGTTTLLWTAGANGGVAGSVLIKAPSVSTATVARFFLNNGGSPATAANNTLIAEYTIPAVTATSVASTQPFELALNRPVPAGWRVYVCLATSVTGAIAFTLFGGDF